MYIKIEVSNNKLSEISLGLWFISLTVDVFSILCPSLKNEH